MEDCFQATMTCTLLEQKNCTEEDREICELVQKWSLEDMFCGAELSNSSFSPGGNTTESPVHVEEGKHVVNSSYNLDMEDLGAEGEEEGPFLGLSWLEGGLGLGCLLMGGISAIMCCKAGKRCISRRMTAPGPFALPAQQKKGFLHPSSILSSVRQTGQQKQLVLYLQRVDALLESEVHLGFLQQHYQELVENIITKLVGKDNKEKTGAKEDDGEKGEDAPVPTGISNPTCQVYHEYDTVHFSTE